MVATVWLLVWIGIIALILGAWILVYCRKKKCKLDYYTFFLIGLIWIPLGIATGIPTFWSLGLVFFILGLTNRNKWKKKKDWGKLRKKEKNVIFLSIFIGLLILTLGMVFYFLVKTGLVG